MPELVAGGVVLPSENDIVRAFLLGEPNRRSGQVPAVPVASTRGPVATAAAEAHGYAETMTDAKQVTEEEETTLDAEDRVWLDEQLDRYSELLTYLREH
ncbi:MAG: hypothetical protein QOI56_669 [Actinomycetota bacterium]|nr:hypothetical protein [Actinomycetota bacterium]